MVDFERPIPPEEDTWHHRHTWHILTKKLIGPGPNDLSIRWACGCGVVKTTRASFADEGANYTVKP